jgi:hypothetical protein
VQKWALRACGGVERWLLIAGGLALVYPSFATKGAGAVIVAVVILRQAIVRTGRTPGAS